MRSGNLLASLFLGLAVITGILFALHTVSGQVSPARAETAAPRAAVDTTLVISQALEYLRQKQLPDGGIEGYVPGSSDEFTSIKTVIAVASAKRPASFLTRNSLTPLDYLAGHAITYTHVATGTGPLLPGRAGMVAVAAVAGDANPSDFGHMDILGEIGASYHPATGAYSTTAQEGFASGAASTINQLWSILGLAAAQSPVPVTATQFLLGLQEADGGWGYGFGGDVDTTSFVIQSLIASSNITPGHPKVQRGLTFLRSVQSLSGGWASFGSLSADSTAAVMQAAAAAGYVPVSASWTTPAGFNPTDDLLKLRLPDGSFGADQVGNSLSTAHAIPGLAEAPIPVLGRRQKAGLALAWLQSQQQADGSWAAFGDPAGPTSDAALAFATAGFDPATVMAAGSPTSALTYLESSAARYSRIGPDTAGKLAVAVAASGRNPRDFGGVDIISVLTTTHYSPTLGAFGTITNTWHQAFGILALASASASVPSSAVSSLVGLQQSDGGWKFDTSPADWNTTGADSTGLALEALAAAGLSRTSPVIVSGTAFLKARQESSGAWSDANGSAYAIQGLLALGENLALNWRQGGQDPYWGLASFQKPNGPFVWAWSYPADNFLATAQAVPALLDIHYPYTPAASLLPYRPAPPAPDSDRLVSGRPSASRSGSDLIVRIPFGSDLNADGTVTLTYRLNRGALQTAATNRDHGFYSATLGWQIGRYDFLADFADPDGVQGPSSYTAQFPDGWRLYLPLSRRGSAQ